MTSTDERPGMPSDNAAVMAGYTREIFATSSACDLCLLIKPDTDLDGTFRAWDMENQEWLRVNGWLFSIEEVSHA